MASWGSRNVSVSTMAPTSGSLNRIIAATDKTHLTRFAPSCHGRQKCVVSAWLANHNFCWLFYNHVWDRIGSKKKTLGGNFIISWKRIFLNVNLFLHFNRLTARNLPAQWRVLFCYHPDNTRLMLSFFQLKCVFVVFLLYLFILLVSGFEMYL